MADSPATLAGFWQTTVTVRCRYEPEFKARIRFNPIPGKGLVPCICCPNCGRVYFLEDSGEWVSDRPLVIIDDCADTPADPH